MVLALAAVVGIPFTIYAMTPASVLEGVIRHGRYQGLGNRWDDAPPAGGARARGFDRLAVHTA
jgi:hypothetical protein